MAVELIEGSVVATRLDPDDALPAQIACLRRWQALGVGVMSFNVRSEGSRLLAAGLQPDVLVEIEPHEAVTSAAGAVLPRMTAVLGRLRETGAPRSMVVDPRVFPAVARNPLPLWGSLGDIVGLCRGEGLCLPGPESDPGTSIVTGVQGFVFSRAGLAATLEAAQGLHEAEPCALGEPGWEWTLASQALEGGATMVDSGPLLGGKRPDPSLGLPQGLRARLASACRRQRDHSRVMRLALGEPAGPKPPAPAHLPDAPRPFDQALQALRGHLDDAEISALMDSQLARPDWQALSLSFQRLEVGMTPTSAYLEALKAVIVLAGQRGWPRWSTLRPADPDHGRRLRESLSDPTGSAAQRRLRDRFARDLHERNLLDTTLLKYVLATCRHEVEQRQFEVLLGLLKERVHGSAAAA